jgi:hypothetical protein
VPTERSAQSLPSGEHERGAASRFYLSRVTAVSDPPLDDLRHLTHQFLGHVELGTDEADCLMKGADLKLHVGNEAQRLAMFVAEGL